IAELPAAVAVPDLVRVAVGRVVVGLVAADDLAGHVGDEADGAWPAVADICRGELARGGVAVGGGVVGVGARDVVGEDVDRRLRRPVPPGVGVGGGDRRLDDIVLLVGGHRMLDRAEVVAAAAAVIIGGFVAEEGGRGGAGLDLLADR